jgi:cytochrome c oxidase subunit 3
MLSSIKKFNLNTQEHPYFLVTPSIVPMLTSISIFLFVSEVVNFFYSFSYFIILYFSIFSLIFILFEWFYNVGLESGYHTKTIQFNNKLAFLMFILTEIMFFFSMFWAFFHASLSPAIAFDNTWPPKGLLVINAFGPPLWGTWVLWLSGLYSLYIKDLVLHNYKFHLKTILTSFISLLFLAISFTVCQVFEFYLATFSFREGIYGSIFYFLTGFHGIHVVVGTIYLIICLVRLFLKYKRENINSGISLYPRFVILLDQSFFKYKKKNLKISNNYWFVRNKLIKFLYNFLKLPSYNSEQNFFGLFCNNSLFIPLKKKNYKVWETTHFVGLETAIWYWQFVDIVWIFVWSIIYIWGNNTVVVHLEPRLF